MSTAVHVVLLYGALLLIFVASERYTARIIQLLQFIYGFAVGIGIIIVPYVLYRAAVDRSEFRSERKILVRPPSVPRYNMYSGKFDTSEPVEEASQAAESVHP
jgi:hypothetical protein